MTCIVGLTAHHTVYLACDSAVAHGVELDLMMCGGRTKLFRRGPFIVGQAGDCRIADLVQYAWSPPPRMQEEVDDDRTLHFMVGAVVPGIRACLESGGIDLSDLINNHILLGYDGRLFEIDGRFSVTESSRGYGAAGTGRRLALGSMYATANTDLVPEKRLLMALDAAEAHDTNVRRPFHVITSARPF